MDSSEIVFEPTRSFAYRLARYTVLPEVTKQVEGLNGQQFLLRDIAWPVLDRLVTKEQQDIRVPRAKAEGDERMYSILRGYVTLLARKLNIFESLGNGYFRAHTEADIDEDELLDAAIESDDEEANESDGWIYAFSFPAIVKSEGCYPIKIGKTRGDVQARVDDQARASVSFERPAILGKWKVQRIGPSELAIHNVLKARNKWREDAPGKEWFDTTPTEIESIISFISPSNRP